MRSPHFSGNCGILESNKRNWNLYFYEEIAKSVKETEIQTKETREKNWNVRYQYWVKGIHIHNNDGHWDGSWGREINVQTDRSIENFINFV